MSGTRKKCHILSLSGGGFLGLYTIRVIEHIEEKLGSPIARHFDLIAGTSIGGIIALGLAKEIPATDIRKAFETRGIEIFPKYSTARKFLRGMKGPMYSDDGLKCVLQDLLGETTLIGDLSHPIIVPTVNLTSGLPQIFKTPHHSTFETDYQRKLVDVALATSAAPLYFPLAGIENSQFTDGGLFANAPDLVALHESTHFLKYHEQDISLLSIGTTTAKFSLSHKTGKNLGIIGWTSPLSNVRLISAIMASQQAMTDNIVRHKLSDRYLRVDTPTSIEQSKNLSLDNASPDAARTIMGLADEEFKKLSREIKFSQFLEHRPSNPVFFYGPHKTEEVS